MKRFRAAAALLPLAVLVLSGCSDEASEVTVQPVAVSVIEAQVGSVTKTSTVSGQLEPILSVTITSKGSGQVMAVYKQMGDAVSEGDLLVELDPADPASQVAAARAQYNQALAQKADAERQVEKLEYLFQQGAISEQQLDQAQTQARLASAQVEAAQAQLNLASSLLTNTRITAPADGVLSARLVEPGMLVGAGTPVFQLVDLSRVVVNAGVAEAVINWVKPGTEVPVRIPALEQTFTGVVESVSPSMDLQTRSYKVRIVMENPDGLLKGGMFAEVQFPLEEQEGILVPVTALLESAAGYRVFIVEDGVAREVAVQVGVRSDQQAVVTGLEAGQQVVVVGQTRLYDGAPVRIGGGQEQ